MSKSFYIWKDISSDKRGYLIFLVQMMIAMYLIALSFNQIAGINNIISETQSLQYRFHNQNAYIFQDKTPPGKIEDIAKDANIKELYKFYNSVPGEKYCMYGYFPYKDKAGNNIEERVINEDFIKEFDIPIETGRCLNISDFNWKDGSVVPILVGHNLQQKFKFNQTYTFSHGGKNFRGLVIGIIKNNTALPNFQEIGHYEVLNDSYIIPLSDTFVNNYFIFSDFDMALTSTIILPSSTNDLKNIIEKSAQLNLYSMEFISINEMLNQYLKDIMPSLNTKITISVIITLFACLGMISHIYALVKKNKKNFAIHIACGARPKDIIYRLLGQILIISFIAYVPCIFQIGFNIANIYMIIGILVISMIILLPSIISFRSNLITLNIKKND